MTDENDQLGMPGQPLILIGPTPPPVHGVSFMTGHTLRAVRSAGVLAAHLDTRDPRPISTIGRFDITNAWLALVHAARLIRLLRRYPRAGVHLPLSQSRWGFLRDAVLIAISSLAGRHVIADHNGGSFKRFYRRSSLPERALMRWTLRRVDEAWVLTEANRDCYGDLIPPDRVRIRENTADPVPATKDAGAASERDELHILQLSNLIPEKGCIDLLDALDELDGRANGIRVRFVGEADDRIAAEVAARGRRLGGRGVEVRTAGLKLGAEKAAEYESADLFVLPTRYPLEGQPLALLEAMSAGLPIISTDHAAIPTTVRDGREALIVSPGDRKALAEAIERLRDDATERERLGSNARARYEERYSPEVFDRAVRERVLDRAGRALTKSTVVRREQRPVGIAVLGCGGVACQYHLRSLSRTSDARVVALADPLPAARERGVAMTGASAFENPEQALGLPDVDAVIVCAENRAHASLACAVTESGKDLYLEKPIALSLEDAQRVVEAAERNRVTATIGFNFRFHPLYLELRELLRSGQIGRLREARTRFVEPIPVERRNGWRSQRELGGGSLLDLGSHHLDLLRWFLGDQIEDVQDVRLDSVHSDHDTAWFAARTSGGTNVEAEFAYEGPRVCTWEFVGDRGRLLADRHAGMVRLLPLGGANGLRTRERARRRLTALPLLNREPTFKLAMGAFIDRLRGVERELPTLEDGLRSLESLLQVEARATGA